MDTTTLEHYRRAGRIGAQALKLGKRMIKPGGSLLKVADTVERYIRDHGAEVAFPVNLAINDQAAHFTPKHDDTTSSFSYGDVVKLDIGAHIEGCICDTALTVEVGGRNWDTLLTAAKEALAVAIQTVRPGVSVGTIGARVEQTIAMYNYTPISNLTGHSLEPYKLHAGLSIPNVRDASSTTKLKQGDVVAIEPFATNGAGHVDGSSPSNIYIFREDRRVKNEDAAELLEAIKRKRRGLPFSERFCARYIDEPGRAIQYLVRVGAILSYPILSDIDKGIVSQFEHTIRVTSSGAEVLSRH